MAKYSLQLTKHYLRDLKLARKRGMDESLLNEVIGKLLDGKPLPKKNHDHQLQTSQGVCPPVIWEESKTCPYNSIFCGNELA